MVSAQERLTRTFTRSSHTYTRTERTEISKTRAGETKREVRVEESTQVGGEPFRDVFGDFLGRDGLSGFNGMPAGSRPPLQDGVWSRMQCCLSNFRISSVCTWEYLTAVSIRCVFACKCLCQDARKFFVVPKLAMNFVNTVCRDLNFITLTKLAYQFDSLTTIFLMAFSSVPNRSLPLPLR